MAILSSKPSRSYAEVNHDATGLSSAGSVPYAMRKDGFKTYRPPLSETHLKRTGLFDSNPDSAFAPLPPAFNISSRHRKEQQAAAGRRAELDHILEPEYKSVSNYSMDDDNGAGPSNRNGKRGGVGGSRTAGGLGGLRAAASIHSLKPNGSGGSGSGKKALPGEVYMDANGKIHDMAYDPFAGVSEMSRRKSKQQGAFGAPRKRGSDTESNSSNDSLRDRDRDRASSRNGAKSPSSAGTGGGTREEEEIRRRLESERRQLDEVSGVAAARRRSVISARSEGKSPSIRSADETHSELNGNGHGQDDNGGPMSKAQSVYLDRLNGRSRSNQGSYVRSPLSPDPNNSRNPPYSAGSQAGRTLTTVEDSDEQPVKSTENTDRPVTTDPEPVAAPTPAPKAPAPKAAAAAEKEPKKMVEIKKGATTRVLGFDAPHSPMPPPPPAPKHTGPTASSSSHLNLLDVPHSARLSAGSRASRNSSDTHREHVPRSKPAERPREDLFPETPAQQKKREDRAKRHAHLAVDTRLAANATAYHGGRILPEIEIVEDDDPRIVFPSEGGRVTRIQKKYGQADHVIRSSTATPSISGSAAGGGGPFSMALNAHAQGHLDDGRPGSTRSMPGGSGSKAPSDILEEGPGGYLPSRWAKGDTNLRVTEDERDKYRPKEWGGKTGDLGGRPAEWRPTTKESLKKEWKDLQTNARFSLFRAGKKLGRKTEF